MFQVTDAEVSSPDDRVDDDGLDVLPARSLLTEFWHSTSTGQGRKAHRDRSFASPGWSPSAESVWLFIAERTVGTRILRVAMRAIDVTELPVGMAWRDGNVGSYARPMLNWPTRVYQDPQSLVV
jgi:hypothetical protein